MIKKGTKTMIALGVAFLPLLAGALTFKLPPKGDDLVGQLQYVHAEKGENIYNIARQYEMGFYELIEANPGINRHSPISPKDTITIPSEYILPNVPRKGIVINLTELRIYYYPENKNIVRTEPITIGKYNWETPTLETTIIEKIKDPAWHVPKSIKKENPSLPDVVPAGPKNPLGTHALRLGERSYLIHGTNAPYSIGKRASHGCIRMYPEDIETIFQQVPKETPVRIINEYYKLGWKNKKLYLEVHEPLRESAQPQHEQIREIHNEIEQATQGKPIHIDWQSVNDAIKKQNGVPVPISSKVSYQTQPYESYETTEPYYHTP